MNLIGNIDETDKWSQIDLLFILNGAEFPWDEVLFRLCGWSWNFIAVALDYVVVSC